MKINKVMFQILQKLESIGFKIVMIRRIAPYIYMAETETIIMRVLYYKNGKRWFISIQYV
jgi:hypothetical protein